MTTPSIAFYPPLPPAAYLRRPASPLPFPLEEPGCRLFARGRHAIWQAARALGLGRGDVVLAPAWHHGAEIEALRRAGLEIAFYELGPDLEPDADELDALAGGRARALFLIHYLGFAQDAARWRAWCDERGLLLFEDAAHACLARAGDRPAGAWGDAAIWCLFKSFAVPDGAALRLVGTPPSPDHEAGWGAGAAARRHAQWVLQRAPLLAGAARRRGPGSGDGFDLHAEIALGEPGSPPSAATARLLPRLAREQAGVRRRANYAILLEELSGQVAAPFGELPAGAVPLGFPLTTDNKRALLDRLAARGVDAVDFWSRPHPLLPHEQFQQTQRRRASTVLLPVHQELRVRDLVRIVDAARERPRRPRGLRVERAESIDELRGEWSRLAEAAGNLFATPEWTAAWCRHFLRGRRLELLAFRSASGRLVGVLPLYVLAEHPVRILRIAGHGAGEGLGPVCAAADRVRVARALVGAMPSLRAQLLLVDHVSRDAGWSRLTGARVLRSEASPVVSLDAGDWDRFMAARSRRLRKEVRRHQRLLESDHSVRYRLSEGASDGALERDLATLFALHEARWRDGGSTFAAHHAFHREFAGVASDRGWLRLWFLEVDGRAVAATCAFRYAGVEFDYQGGRDPDWRGPSLGLILLARTIRAALEDGVTEYRLLRGDQAYKYRFADRDPGLETIVLARGPIGRAAAAAGAGLPEPLATLVRRRLSA